MIILGIDPGYAILGYGIVGYTANRFTTIAYGAIKTSSKLHFPQRLNDIYDSIRDIIKLHKPDSMAIEKIFFTTNQKTAIEVSHARGIVMLAGNQTNTNIFEYTPLQVKQAVVGYGKANKKQVIDMTKRILNLNQLLTLDDIADSLAIAICHAHTSQSKLKCNILKGTV